MSDIGRPWYRSLITLEKAPPAIPPMTPNLRAIPSPSTQVIVSGRTPTTASATEPARSPLLVLERLAKSLFSLVDEPEVAGPIDERIRLVLGLATLEQLSLQVEEASMRA